MTHVLFVAALLTAWSLAEAPFNTSRYTSNINDLRLTPTNAPLRVTPRVTEHGPLAP
jgi:hypothetical protein